MEAIKLSVSSEAYFVYFIFISHRFYEIDYPRREIRNLFQKSLYISASVMVSMFSRRSLFLLFIVVFLTFWNDCYTHYCFSQGRIKGTDRTGPIFINIPGGNWWKFNVIRMENYLRVKDQHVFWPSTAAASVLASHTRVRSNEPLTYIFTCAPTHTCVLSRRVIAVFSSVIALCAREPFQHQISDV